MHYFSETALISLACLSSLAVIFLWLPSFAASVADRVPLCINHASFTHACAAGRLGQLHSSYRPALRPAVQIQDLRLPTRHSLLYCLSLSALLSRKTGPLERWLLRVLPDTFSFRHKLNFTETASFEVWE